MQSLPDKNYYPGLDALRGIAVMSVVLYHVFPNAAIFSWGWMGVDLFFVISGFLITSILLQANKQEKGFFKHFYARRLLRILPLCFALLVLFFTAVALLDKNNLFLYYRQNWWYYFLFLQNWLFIAKGFPQEYYLNHFWSLAVEEQFYLLFPFVVYFFTSSRLIRAIPFLVLAVCCFRSLLWYHYPDYLQVYYCNTFTRIDSILMGCLLGCGYKMKRSRPAILLLVLSLIILGTGIIFYQSASLRNPVLATVGYTLIAFLFFLFLQRFTQSDNTFLLLRRNKVLNFIGKISYGIYLIHLPVYLVVTSLSVKLLGDRAAPLLIGTISIFITLVASTVSYFTLETYFLRQKRFFPIQPVKQKSEPSFRHPVEDNITG